MGHSLVQHLARALLALACASCIGATGNDRHPPPPAPRAVAYVSPTGADTNDGEVATPFKTIRQALAGTFEKIVLLRGAYDEEKIEITRGVTIEGDGPVVLRGHLFITGSQVTLRRVSIGDGIAAHFVENLTVDNATIAAGSKDDAVEVTRSSASFARVKLNCGGISCMQATTATVTIEDCIASGRDGTKRILRFDMSRVRLARTRTERSSVAHLQLSGGSQVEVDGFRASGGSNGIVVIQGASLSARNVLVKNASKMSLVGQRSKLRIEDSIFGGTLDQTIGLSGTDAVFRNVIVEGSQAGAVSVVDHIVGKAVVRFEGGEIQHGRASGILVGSGVVTVAGVRFVGSKAKGEDNDAITASGVDSRVIVESATIETPSGFGVAFHSDASGSVTATISNPRLGGVLVEDVATEPIAIAQSVISGCAEGAGIVVQGARALVERVRIDGCKEAGVLAGEKGTVVISRSSLTNNAMYGSAAFGGAHIEVNATRIRGSKFATFASCGDGARVEDKGNNRLEGTVSACP